MDLIHSQTLDALTSSIPLRRESPACVSDIVQRVLLSERQGLRSHEQRESDRYPFSQLVQLTPYDTSAAAVTGEPITTTCRNLSLNGLGFYYNEPLHARHALVHFLKEPEHPQVLMKLVWCRFIKPNWYDNGGRFVRIAKPAA